MILIEVSDLNSQSIEAVLDDDLFFIILDWNDSGQYWHMAIRNSAYATLVDGICAVPNYPLLKQFKYPDLPNGDLQIVYTNDIDGPPPRDGFERGIYQLVYLTEQEVLTAINVV